VRRVVALFLLLSLSVAAWPCLWDNDTLAAEARGLPTVLDAIVGRIPVNPPEYYKRRIEISEAAIKADSSKLEHYDNLAVAHDKLGNFEKAMKAMIEKQAAMAQMKLLNDEHMYRYHANIGTIFAHEWVRQQPNGEPAMLELAIAEIAKAIEINPDAHFGREKVQLRLLETLAQVSGVRPEGDYKELSSWQEFARQMGPKECAEAVIAIMSFGGSPENRDLLAVLNATIPSLDGHLLYMAELREKELKAAGKKMWIEDNSIHGYVIRYKNRAKDQYKELREDAKLYQATYSKFVLDQIALGRHPDTHADFWKTYVERPRLRIAEPSWVQQFLETRSVEILVGSILSAPILIWAAFRIRKRLKAKAA